MPTEVIGFAAAAPVIVGVISALKIAGLPSRFAPLSALVLGLVASFFIFPSATVGLSAFWGIAAGLTASGLYSGAKASFTPTPNLSNSDSDTPTDPISPN